MVRSGCGKSCLNWVVKEVLSNEITVGGDMETGDEKGQ